MTESYVIWGHLKSGYLAGFGVGTNIQSNELRGSYILIIEKVLLWGARVKVDARMGETDL